MADETYLFIDGEYLRQVHREAMRDFFGTDVGFTSVPARALRGRSSLFDVVVSTKAAWRGLCPRSPGIFFPARMQGAVR